VSQHTHPINGEANQIGIQLFGSNNGIASAPISKILCSSISASMPESNASSSIGAYPLELLIAFAARFR
jgi:hypothetical protein